MYAANVVVDHLSDALQPVDAYAMMEDKLYLTYETRKQYLFHGAFEQLLNRYTRGHEL